MLTIQATADDLRLQAANHEAAIEYRLPGAFPPESIAVPLAALEDCEGRSPDPVTFIPGVKGSVQVDWTESGIPQQRSYTVERKGKPPISFPARPDQWAANDAGLLAAINDAGAVVDRSPTRYAINCLQLQGDLGRIAATDGRHLLVQSGFQFPWPGEVLVPFTKVFGCPELPRDQPIQVGRAGNQVAFGIGPWTLFFTVAEGHFPSVDGLIRSQDSFSTHVQIAADSAFLARTLKSLPGIDGSDDPVTLDANGTVAIRARADGQTQPTELVLANSSFTGEPLRIAFNRQYLVRAIRLGFTQLCLKDADSALQCHDERRDYIFMPISPESAIGPSVGAICVRSDEPSAGQQHSPSITATRRRASMPTSTTQTPNIHTPAASSSRAAEQAGDNGHGETTDAAYNGALAGSPIEQAVALQKTLREAHSQTNELIRSLRRQKKQSRLVQSTLQSLKQLQAVA